MAQRILDTAFWDDETIASLTRDERLLFACMVTDTSLSDDFGVLPASPRILKKHAFGYDDDVTIDDVAAWRNGIIAKSRNVVLGTVNGQEYAYLVNFPRWQQLRHHRKSNYPTADEVLRASQNTKTSTDCGNLPQNSGKGSQDFGNFPLDRIGLDSVGLNRGGEDCAENSPAPAENPASAREAETEAPPALDPLGHIFELATGGDLDHAGIADPTKDIELFQNAAVLAYKDESGRDNVPKASARLICRLSASPGFDLQFWRLVVAGYVTTGWNPGSVSTMIDYYNRHEVPERKDNGHGQNQHSVNSGNRGGSQGERPDTLSAEQRAVLAQFGPAGP